MPCCKFDETLTSDRLGPWKCLGLMASAVFLEVEPHCFQRKRASRYIVVAI